MSVRLLTLCALTACSISPREAALPFAGPDGEAVAAKRAVADQGMGEDTVVRAVVDGQQMAHVRLQQWHHGVRVRGGQASVHYEADGTLRRLTEHRLRGIAVDPSPTFDEATAVTGAVLAFGADRLTAEPVAQLQIARLDGVDHLVWSVRLQDLGVAHPELLIDAHTGSLLRTFETLKRGTGTGASSFYGTVDLPSVLKNGKYYLEYRDARLGTFDGCGSKSALSSISDGNNVWNGSSKTDVVDAHFAASAWYDYFDGVHGREGVDGDQGPGLKGAKKDSWNVLSVGTGAAGNYWTGGTDPHACIASANGALDIVGHELTHGWLEHTVDFVAGDLQTGALEESLADVGAALVEHDVLGDGDDRWRIGEEVSWSYTVRSLEDPPSELREDPLLAYPLNQATCYIHRTTGEVVKGFDPDLLCLVQIHGICIDEYDPHTEWLNDKEDVDHMDDFADPADFVCGEAHTNVNVGIPNHAFFELQADVGVDDAAAIWFRAVELYLTDTADFAEARDAMEDAATDLFGSTSTEVTAVGDAWDHVGVN